MLGDSNLQSMEKNVLVNIQMDTFLFCLLLISYLFIHNNIFNFLLKRNIKIIPNTSEWFLSFFLFSFSVFQIALKFKCFRLFETSVFDMMRSRSSAFMDTLFR